MTKEVQLALVKRELAIKHKLNVLDNCSPQTSHEEQAEYLICRWQLEDELKAIGILIDQFRSKNVSKFQDLHSRGNLNEDAAKILAKAI